MKSRNTSKGILLAAAAACLWGNACSKAKSNQVLVSVSPAQWTLVVTQSVTLTAIVTGATDVSSSFACTFTTTPNPTTAVPSPKASAPAPCTSEVGTLSNIVNSSTTSASTATFTAPATFPDATKFPNLLISITATAKADTKKTGTGLIAIDSGIRLQMIPATATLATGEKKQFVVEDFTGTVVPNSSLNWDVTADATATSTSKTCTPTCGTVDSAGVYTAPAAVPTQATATVVATSTVDLGRRAQASITIVKAGDIAFTGISPSIAPQGALQQDIFLAATNATSQIGVTLIDNSANTVTIDPAQIKVIFAAGASTASIGAGVRLLSKNLKTAGHFQIKVSSSNTSINVTGGPFPLDIVPVRPTLVGSTPDNFQESTFRQIAGLPLRTDGAYFGRTDGPTVRTLFNNQTQPQQVSVPTARRLTGFLPTPSGTGPNAGLFPLSIQYTVVNGSPFPPPVASASFTNIAVIPDYGGSNPPTDLGGNRLTSTTLPTTIPLPASSAPSAVAVDPVLDYAVATP